MRVTNIVRDYVEMRVTEKRNEKTKKLHKQKKEKGKTASKDRDILNSVMLEFYKDVSPRLEQELKALLLKRCPDILVGNEKLDKEISYRFYNGIVRNSFNEVIKSYIEEDDMLMRLVRSRDESEKIQKEILLTLELVGSKKELDDIIEDRTKEWSV